MNIRRADQVVVISGDDKGKKGRVLAVYPDTQRVVVEGVNFVKRHTRAKTGQQSGIVEREASIHVSNVMLLDPADGRPVRVGHHVLQGGRRERVARRSGEVIPENQS
ncbi:MAG: 50S ribosomal protein L24 [bacterium]